MYDETFVFGSFQLISAQRLLLDDGKPLRPGGHALNILITLLEGSGETIHKDRLIARAWPDTIVDDGALRVHIAALRAAAELAEAVLKTAPSVHSLAISREPLRAEGEGLHLASLEVPPVSTKIASDDPLRYPAVQLFVGPSHGDRGHGGGT